MRLTKASVSTLRLRPGQVDQIFFDDQLPGFGIRLRAAGSRTWVVQYRTPNGQRRLRLGPASIVSVEQARQRAKEVLATIALGGDPQHQRRTQERAQKFTLGTVTDEYLSAKRHQLKPRSFVEVHRYLTKVWSSLHDVPLDHLTRAHVSERLREVGIKSGRITADRARSSLSALCNWAHREGYLTLQNPVAATNRQGGRSERERVLSDTELSEIWTACDASDHGLIVKLLMLLPMRRNEVGGIARPEIDFQNGMWTLAACRSKNGHANEIPLPPAALDLLKSVAERDGKETFFGRTSGAGYSGWSRSKEALDKRILAGRRIKDPNASMFEWRLHDIRRTIATRLYESDVQPNIVEGLLNHHTGHRSGVSGVYNRARYLSQKLDALCMWERYLLGRCAEGEGNVIPLRAASCPTQAA